MAAKNLLISDPSYVAEFVRNSEFQSLTETRMAVAPDHMALLIRDGEIVDVFKGANFSIGGLLARIRSVFGGRHSFALLLASLKPFQVQLDVEMITKDKAPVTGVATLELQVDPEKPANILGLMRARMPLTEGDVLARVAPHFSERVFGAVGAKVTAAELRGNVEVQDLIQGEIMRETDRVIGDLGIYARIVSVEWALTDTERDEMTRAATLREQEMLDFALEVTRRETARAADSSELEIRTKTDLAKLEAASEDELNHLILKSELEFADARETGQRLQEMKALQHEVEVLRTERVAKFENELAEAGHSIEIQRQKLELRKVDLEMQKLERLQSAEITKLEQMDKLDIAARGNEIAAANIRTLQDIELQGQRAQSEMRMLEEDAAARREIDKSSADTLSRVEMMKAGATMTPEQILAVNAGLSADVAMVLAEQARAKAAEGESTMALMREFVDRAREDKITTAEQAQQLGLKALDSNIGVAQGAGGGGAADGSPPPGAAGTIECAQCGRTNAAQAKFCVGCGHRLRT
ncbi:MAG: hypothetical protein AAGA32_13100 [Pseudomonadota bacterium]